MRIRVCRLDKCQEDEPDEPRRRTTTADDHEGQHDDTSQPGETRVPRVHKEARNEADSVDRVTACQYHN